VYVCIHTHTHTHIIWEFHTTLHNEFSRHIAENENYRWHHTTNKTELPLYQAASKPQGDWNTTLRYHGEIRSRNVPPCTAFIFNNQQVLDKAFFQDLLILEDQGNILLQ
jgi:hypothetical protein